MGSDTRETKNVVRIIGGKWRGRRLQFPSGTNLRPTHDRIRETLFNWLMHDLTDACCLDLFAGSGALGLEALSRGAARVTFVDSNPAACVSIQHHLKAWESNDAVVIDRDYRDIAFSLLEPAYDIVFLDPPFKQNALAPAIDWLLECDCLKQKSKIYIEVEKGLVLSNIPSQWNLYRHKSTSTLDYYLFDCT